MTESPCRHASEVRACRPVPDVAYYYPAPFWSASESSWAKSLLLFFDRLAILLPGYMYGRHLAADESLVAPLEDAGLLEVLEPEEWVDQKMTEELAAAMHAMLQQGVFDDLPEVPPGGFHELSQSRLGHGADLRISDDLVGTLRSRGLATASQDGVSIPLHPVVRTTVLVLLGQLSRRAGQERGVTIHPTTSRPDAVQDLMRVLSLEPMPSAGHVINFDLEAVSFDLETIPLDEVLGFRDDHAEEHRAYMRDLRGFMVELGQLPPGDDRDRLLVERQQELADAAHALRTRARMAFGKNLGGLLLGIAGAAWSVAGVDILGALIGGAGLVAGVLPVPAASPNAYSYFFSLEGRFG